jgi:hypothetical protein
MWLWPEETVQTRTVPSVLADAKRWPPGEKDKLVTAFRCPTNFCLCLVVKFQRLIELSCCDQAMIWSSGENRSAEISPPPLLIVLALPSDNDQTITCPSSVAVANRTP